jgi:hypothetical protein
MSTETILVETARKDWPNLTGTIAPHGLPEVHLTYQADRTLAMSPNDARELARWLTDAARQIEATTA